MKAPAVAAVVAIVGWTGWAGCRSEGGGRHAEPASPEPASQRLAPAIADPEPTVATEAGQINPRFLRRFQPVGGARTVARADADKIALGRDLFYERRLSRTGQVACSSCHSLSRFGIDGLVTSAGVGGAHGRRNAPTVFNAATHIAQFWDGRAATVEQQASGPILDPVEMAMPSEQAVVAALEAIPTYVERFRKAFPGDPKAVTLENVGQAIGAFERGLVTRSRWDRFIVGDASALSPEEKHGLRVFVDVGCVSCHTGPQVGGSMFQKAGAMIPWPNQKDQGRFAVTGSPGDRMVFKVPSLKNIAETAPYFHDGSTADLGEAIRLMAHHQLGIELADDEVDAIRLWMGSMTGQIDRSYTMARQESGDGRLTPGAPGAAGRRPAGLARPLQNRSP